MSIVPQIIIPNHCKPWPHELKMAQYLVRAGFSVEFLIKSEVRYQKTADCLIDSEPWEFKSPRSDNLQCIHRNLTRGKNQSVNICFSSIRMKHVPDDAIIRELRTQVLKVSGISRLKFISRNGSIVDIK